MKNLLFVIGVIIGTVCVAQTETKSCFKNEISTGIGGVEIYEQNYYRSSVTLESATYKTRIVPTFNVWYTRNLGDDVIRIDVGYTFRYEEYLFYSPLAVFPPLEAGKYHAIENTFLLGVSKSFYSYNWTLTPGISFGKGILKFEKDCLFIDKVSFYNMFRPSIKLGYTLPSQRVFLFVNYSFEEINVTSLGYSEQYIVGDFSRTGVDGHLFTLGCSYKW